MTDAEIMLKDCLNRQYKMNEWEHRFIQTITELDNLEDLSYKQYEILGTIWDRIA